MKPKTHFPAPMLLAVVFWTPGAVAAQDVVSLAQALERARTGNRLYQARLQKAEAVRPTVAQAYRRPNPELESAVEASVDGDDYSFSVSVAQTWERGGKRQLRRSIAQSELDQALLEAEDFWRILESDIRLAYLEATLLGRQQEILQAHIQRVDRMVQLDEVRAREGEIAALNVDHLKIELSRWTIQKAELESRMETVLYQLNALTGVPGGATFALRADEVEPAAPPAVDQAIETALRTRPDLKRLRLAVEAADHEVQRQIAEGKRDWTLGMGYARDRAIVGADGIRPAGVVRSIRSADHLLELKLQIPIPVWDDNSGNVEAALGRKRASEHEVAYAESQVRSELREAYQRMELNRRLNGMLRQEVLPRLEDDLRREEDSYLLTGQGLGDWLRDQENLTVGALREAETAVGLLKSMVELEKIMGAGSGRPSTGR